MPFTKGKSGNPRGRQRGSRNKGTFLRRKLESRSVEIIETVIAAAKNGDLAACKLILDRVCPPLRAVDSTVAPIPKRGSLAARGERVLAKVLNGTISSDQAASLLSALRAQADLVAHTDLEGRVKKLEAAHDDGEPDTSNPQP